MAKALCYTIDVIVDQFQSVPLTDNGLITLERMEWILLIRVVAVYVYVKSAVFKDLRPDVSLHPLKYSEASISNVQTWLKWCFYND